MEPSVNILVLNTGSSSTKVALFQDQIQVWKEEIAHPAEQLKSLIRLEEEIEFRLHAIQGVIQTHAIQFDMIHAIGAIGGILKPMEGGVYSVNQTMVEDILTGKTQVRHASNLAAVIGYQLGQPYQKTCYIVDPISTDELLPIAKITGLPTIPRKSRTHALNVKACYRRAVRDHYIEPEEPIIVSHMGGGLTVNLVQKGRITAVEDGRHNGPFSTEAAGGVPLPDFIDYYWDKEIPKKELMKLWYGNGGVMAHLGTNSVKNVVERALNGDKQAEEILQAMCYQICKSVGAMYSAAKGKVKALIFTGGIAQSEYIIQQLKQWLTWINPIIVYPGEEELSAIAESVNLVLAGKIPDKVYHES